MAERKGQTRTSDALKLTEPTPRKRLTAEVYDPTRTPWKTIKAPILHVETKAFPDYEPQEDLLQADFTHPENTVVLLYATGQKAERELVGYIYSEPLAHSYPQKALQFPKTAYVNAIGILPEYQDASGVTELMTALEAQLVEKGYQFAEGHTYIAYAVEPENEAEARTQAGYMEVEGQRFLTHPEGLKFAKDLEQTYRARGMFVETYDEIDNGSEPDETGGMIAEGTGDLTRFLRVRLNQVVPELVAS